MPRIHLTGRLLCRDDVEAATVERHLPDHVARTRAEPGCLRFEVNPTADPRVWSVEELFADEAAFAEHQRNAAASTWGTATAGIERRYEITRVPDGATAAVRVTPFLPEDRDVVIALSVRPEQDGFVATNEASLDEAAEHSFCTPLVVRAGEEIVGFAMCALDPDDGNYWIYRLMIDQRFQGRGYARAALDQILSRMSSLEGCDRILLGVRPDNERAIALYIGAGFVATGEEIDGERVFQRS
ncbi:GNAT family N-acetyltransferase [Microbacterium sp. TNHR37B]|uniref:GNAT family N-acetyltransferase n=1 Tax=Microbacterium sp. TNHR37B TaxID=1775956 RepID=UPI0007B2F74B|nr:GNAT family N-acetyltransferase [Microbacterium sp. TNHR37B]KZE90618.1 Spermine/spermidine acetyltransferase [Microbacterium sp. TNHR37B]